jgi:hypothetical protein
MTTDPLPSWLTRLSIEEWSPVYFSLDGDEAGISEDDDATEATALRIEWWIVAGEQYVFVARSAVTEPWSDPEIGEYAYLDGDAGEEPGVVAGLDDLLPLVRRAKADGATVHPVLRARLAAVPS